MRWPAQALRRLAVAVVVAAAALALAGLDDRDLALRLGGTAVGAAVAMVAIQRMPRDADDGEDPFEAVWRRARSSHSAPPPPERERLRSMVRLSLGTAGDAHSRLRPLLTELADARLDTTYGTHIDSDPRAAERLGPQAWELVRPDRPQPADPLSPGPSQADLEAALGALERLGGAEETQHASPTTTADDPDRLTGHDRLEEQ